MHRPSRIFFLLLFLPGLPGIAAAQVKQGQARLDSLLAELRGMREDSNGAMLMDRLATEYRLINPDEGLKWAGRALTLTQKIGWRKGEARAYGALSANYMGKGAYPDALEANFKALRLHEELGDKTRVGVTYGNIGFVFRRQKQYEKALEYSFKALKTAEEEADKRRMENALGNIGNVYEEQGKHNEALVYKQRALRLAEETDYKPSVILHTGNIGVSYGSMRQYNAALAYYFKAARLAEAIGDKQDVAGNLGNIGIAYYYIATDSIAIRPDSLVPAGKSANLAKGIAFLRKGIDACREVQFSDPIPEFSTYLSQALALQGDYRGALSAYTAAIALKDSLYNIANNEIIANLETKRALQLKDKDIRIAELQVAKKHNERIFYIAGIGLLLAIMGIIVYNFRRHERSRQRIKALQDHKISLLDEAVKRRTEQLGSMRQTIATDFHDQTGNMLAAITRQAATLELKLLHQPEFLPVVRSIINNSNELYASSKDFLWNLNHDSDDPLILFQYLSGYGQRFYNQFDVAFSSIVSGEAQPHMQLHPFAGLNLIYIFKEAMSNVIRHSGADEVDMELRWEAGQVVCSLRDNGAWKEPDGSTEHYGLSNMERRCRQSGFGYELAHGTEGTRISVSLPVSTDFVDTPPGSRAVQTQSAA